jgi:caffeoyl-CoA O-methyltransferase
MNFISSDLNEYCISKSTTPSPVCQELERFTRADVPHSMMLTGPLEASLLGFLIGLTRAKRVLEFGTYTGYSALSMAERLPPDGEVVTLDIDPKTNQIAQSFWQKSPHGKKIRPMLGPALESLKKISGTFDLVFIDADKTSYLTYLKDSLERLSPHGLVALDNCLWDGRVLDAGTRDPETRAIQMVNDYIKQNPALEGCLLPVRDGVFLVRRKN